MIRVEQLTVKRDERRVLDSLSFVIPDGCVAGLLGRNGAGKTTLLNVLAFLTKPERGRFAIGREFPKRGAPRLKERRRVGAVFEHSFLYEHLSAFENLRFYGRLYGVKPLEGRIGEWLGRAGLSAVADRPVHTYSKGMRQRLSIVRAMLHDPDVLLLDEPFDGLDAQSANWIKELIKEKRDQGCSIVLVSHQVDELFACCDRILVLERGRILVEKAVAEVDQERFRQAYSRLLEGAGQDEFLEGVAAGAQKRPRH